MSNGRRNLEGNFKDLLDIVISPNLGSLIPLGGYFFICHFRSINEYRIYGAVRRKFGRRLTQTHAHGRIKRTVRYFSRRFANSKQGKFNQSLRSIEMFSTPNLSFF
jgi:hypothetical protein